MKTKNQNSAQPVAARITTADLSFLRHYSAHKGGLIPLDKLMESHAALIEALQESVEAMEAAGFDTMGEGNAAILNRARETLFAAKS